MNRCPGCGLQFQCICDQLPELSGSLTLSLLTHENEFNRETNTGKWLIRSLPDCRQYRWQRTQADTDLLARLANEKEIPFLLFPSPDSIPLNEALQLAETQQRHPHFIVLDGTWQEAKKIERKSPWLNTVQRVSFTPSQPSGYRLRRNQKNDELCTLEVATELLKAIKEEENANRLESYFRFMMDSYLADKSGHKLIP